MLDTLAINLMKRIKTLSADPPKQEKNLLGWITELNQATMQLYGHWWNEAAIGKLNKELEVQWKKDHPHLFSQLEAASTDLVKDTNKKVAAATRKKGYHAKK